MLAVARKWRMPLSAVEEMTVPEFYLCVGQLLVEAEEHDKALKDAKRKSGRPSETVVSFKRERR